MNADVYFAMIGFCVFGAISVYAEKAEKYLLLTISAVMAIVFAYICLVVNQ